MNRSNAMWAMILILPVCTLHADDRTATIQEYIDAYNRHDIEAMMALVTEDIRWISESDAARVVETRGKSELTVALTSYFSSLPSRRSELARFTRDEQKIIVEETAFWIAKGEDRSQCAVAAYEFDGIHIDVVTYYENRQCVGEEGTQKKIQREQH